MKISDVLRTAQAIYKKPLTATPIEGAKWAINSVTETINEKARAYVILAEADFESAIRNAELDEFAKAAAEEVEEFFPPLKEVA